MPTVSSLMPMAPVVTRFGAVTAPFFEANTSKKRPEHSRYPGHDYRSGLSIEGTWMSPMKSPNKLKFWKKYALITLYVGFFRNRM
jgi:hypothetical protein